MATRYVYSAAAGTNAGTSWTDAYVAFGSAVTASTGAGDVILVHYLHQEEIAGDTDYIFQADNVTVVSVDKDSSNAPTVMGTGGWLGNSTASRAVNLLAPNRKAYLHGVTIRVVGGADQIGFNTGTGAGDGGSIVGHSCYLWQSATSGSNFALGTRGDSQSFTKLINCTFRAGNVGQTISVGNQVVIEGGGLSSAGSAITTIFTGSTSNDNAGTTVNVVGFDCSAASATATILGNNTVTPTTLRMSQCKLPTGAITYLGTQTNVNRSSGEVFLFDCASDDTHGRFVYANALGSVESDTGIYLTAGAAAQAWKIVTTSAATYYTPFETPWIDLYNTGTSAITPYFECLRDGSTTAFQDDEMWPEFAAKATTGFTISTLYSGRMAILGTPANLDAGAGLGSWTGEGGTAWSGKADAGSITPAEAGAIRGRWVVGEPSITVYVDPQIRT